MDYDKLPPPYEYAIELPLRLTWKSADGPRVFDLRFDDLSRVEQDMICDAGMPNGRAAGPHWMLMEGFFAHAAMGHQRALRVALWVLLKRERPSLTFAEVTYEFDLRAGDITVDLAT